ncbi:hypothetical protein KC332_g2907 [Hortaea werneckii]|uniref:Uncharacterized protein n=2 Tax=Hortaea werneckii TaxID=91943 RepID=A0A3M7HD17_HORWE|nr:hypothetical protein KC350_g8150 [Hortaea werneckii]OTA38508.1 hypothetical protein BTJ68_01695 [Hortaea werneckii EXF-2000]KAI6845800.1 hypothetical protein KC358_g3175 [Hortaea werneckii]KAI6941431.1 hypothetical protein KC341_g2904 [Hortaea werneckii]KAI6946420.1 hypothetical protein KC348_g3156 [Hortaea werneckii]
MTNLLRGAALITGAGSGIGQATALAFARYVARQLALCDIRPDAIAQTTQKLKDHHHKDLEILNLEADTSCEADVDNAVEHTAKHFGRLDIAVNNAGINGKAASSDQLEFENWRKTLSVNLDGVWLCQRAEIRQMLKQEALDQAPRGGRGIIVNVASMLGLVGASPSTPAVAYTASKHGMMGLTRTDAVMYAPRGIRINAVCPGYVATPLLEAVGANDILAAQVEKVPQKRFCSVEEVADAISFLASPMSSFVTGHGLVLDGGYSC